MTGHGELWTQTGQVRGTGVRGGGLTGLRAVFGLIGSLSTMHAGEFFIRGNVDGSGEVDITDPAANLEYQFLGVFEPTCLDAADDDDDGLVDITDPIWSLEYQFLGKPEQLPPGPENCGPDPTDDGLSCDMHRVCEPPTIEGFTLLGQNEQGYTEYEHDQTGIVFVLLPGGTFWMGAQADDPEGHNYDPDASSSWWGDPPWEGPVHEVRLSPFLIAKYEVTQRQWLEVMGENPSYFQPGQDGEPYLPPELLENEAWLELPAESVSWNDIQGFEEATGLTLPTEAQWEYAARAGTSTPFSFGTAEACDPWGCKPCPEAEPFMWWCGNSDSGRGPHKVGTRQPNAFGLHDMHGNLWEWCEDVFDGVFYARPEAAGPDPVSTSGSGYRVFRGGDWDYNARDCRSAGRTNGYPSIRFDDVGLRISRPLSP